MIAMARTLKKKQNHYWILLVRVESLVLFLILEQMLSIFHQGNAFHFSPSRIIFTVGLSYMVCWGRCHHRLVVSNSCNPMDVEDGWARILEWVVISFSRGTSQPRNQTQVSCIAGRFFTEWASREDLCGGRFFLYPFSGCWTLSKLFLHKYYTYMHTHAYVS